MAKAFSARTAFQLPIGRRRWLEKEGVAGWINFSVSFFFANLFSEVPTALPSIKWQGVSWSHGWMLFPIMWPHVCPSHDVGCWHFWHVVAADLIIWQEKRKGRAVLPYEAMQLVPSFPYLKFHFGYLIGNGEWNFVEQGSKESSWRRYCRETSSRRRGQKAVYLFRPWKPIYPMLKNPM